MQAFFPMYYEYFFRKQNEVLVRVQGALRLCRTFSYMRLRVSLRGACLCNVSDRCWLTKALQVFAAAGHYRFHHEYTLDSIVSKNHFRCPFQHGGNSILFVRYTLLTDISHNTPQRQTDPTLRSRVQVFRSTLWFKISWHCAPKLIRYLPPWGSFTIVEAFFSSANPKTRVRQISEHINKWEFGCALSASWCPRITSCYTKIPPHCVCVSAVRVYMLSHCVKHVRVQGIPDLLAVG